MVFYIWSIWTNRLICRVIVPQRFWESRHWPLRSRDVMSSVMWPFDWQCMVSRRCSIWIHRLLRTAVEILSLKDTGVTTLTFQVSWRHRSCDHWIPNVCFPIGSQYEPTNYLARLLKYWVSKILGSRSWPFRVTWRHQSRDHWTPDMQFPIGGPLKPSLYIASLLRYYVSNT